MKIRRPVTFRCSGQNCPLISSLFLTSRVALLTPRLPILREWRGFFLSAGRPVVMVERAADLRFCGKIAGVDTTESAWTLEQIRSLRDADGNEPAHREGFATADPGRSVQWIRLTFASGHQRAWECKHLGPWAEIPGLSGTPEPVDYLVIGQHVVGREDTDD